MVSDLLGDNRIGYEFDEIVYGVYGRMYALETLDFLANGQRVVGERRRMAVVIRRTAVHCSVTLGTSLDEAAQERQAGNVAYGRRRAAGRVRERYWPWAAR